MNAQRMPRGWTETSEDPRVAFPLSLPKEGHGT